MPASFTDFCLKKVHRMHTGSIRLVLWEKDIQKVQSRNTYTVTRAIVKTYNGEKYLTLNHTTTIQLSEQTVEREDEQIIVSHIKEVECPAEGVESISKYFSCNKCHSTLANTEGKKIIKCTNCELSQLKSKTKTRTLTKVMFLAEGEQLTLNLFDDKLQQLLEIYKTQNEDEKRSFNELQDEDIVEMLLTVEAVCLTTKKVCSNSKASNKSVRRKRRKRKATCSSILVLIDDTSHTCQDLVSENEH